MRILRLIWQKPALRYLVLVLSLCIAAYLLKCGARWGWSLVHWKANIWVADYWFDNDTDSLLPDDQKHLIFVMVDHYEPGLGASGVEKNARWCEKFRNISDRHHDDYGNRFRYSWFYPFDHHNEAVMQALSQMAFDGYGEIEMHWHIASADSASPLKMTNDTFGPKLQEAIEWFQQFGAMITAEEHPRTAFAYIAGNWDLDSGRNPPGEHGITNQIGELVKHGCYADFTFPAIGSTAQPSKVNNIYYAEDDPKKPKSHDTGADARVGEVVNNRLMIFEGPSTINWDGTLEYGAIEKDPRFDPSHIKNWLKANIHVVGRPEWVFAKVYSHGSQSSSVVLDHDLELLLDSLKRYCSVHGIKLHFMTAREAYNVVKAAESGKTGNPEDYRDFVIPQYRNMVEPVEIRDISQETSSNATTVNSPQ